jgi:predicted CopG family antitoxin
MPTIQISDEVYSRLQSIARPFQDKDPNDVILRLLEDSTGQHDTPILGATQGADLVSHVGRVPFGTCLRARYKQKEYFASIDNGRVLWNGRRFDSLSSAAVAVIQSTGSSRPTENGWRFWEYQEPQTREWLPCNRLLHA